MARFPAALLALLAAALLTPPAIAQFGDPPRPPANIPNRPDVPQAPPVLPPNVPPPNQGRPPGNVQSQPLPPPPSAREMPAAPRQQLPSAQAPPGQSPPAPPPNDDVVPDPPTPKIANPTAVFSGLDKITGRIITFDVAIDETVRFGALEVTPRVCYTRPPTELPQTDGFVEVDELTLQGQLKRIFTGWMFAASPGLNAVEHPIYDVWLTDCKSGGPPAVSVEAVPNELAPPQRAPPGRQRPPARTQVPQVVPPPAR